MIQNQGQERSPSRQKWKSQTRVGFLCHSHVRVKMCLSHCAFLSCAKTGKNLIRNHQQIYPTRNPSVL